jgi:LacI family transcriptional regulator
MLIAWTVEDPSVEINEIQHLLGVGIDAMIIATSAVETSPFNLLHARNIPYVLLDRDLPELKVPFVGVDDVLVGRMATQHLIDIGCRRIAHISGPSTSPGRKRLEGYRAALHEAGIPERPEYVISPLTGPSSFKHGREAIRKLLQVKPRIDGVFCYNDPLALGVYEGIRSAGIRVPQDIAVVGCGNQPVGAMAMHPLTTIDQNTEDLGKKAARAVLELLKSPDKSRHRRRLLSEPKLLIRSTSLRGSAVEGAAGSQKPHDPGPSPGSRGVARQPKSRVPRTASS